MTDVQVDRSWWSFPMKPVRVTEHVLSSLNMSEYTMEKKYDGWRALLVVGSQPELWTRERRRIEMPENLEDQLRSMNLPRGTVLDGEIWNPAKRGGWKHARGVECRLTFWDAIRFGEKNLSQTPLEDRRDALRKLVRETNCVGVVEVLPATRECLVQVQEEAAVLRAVARSGFVHGVVLKRAKSPRRDHATRSQEHPDWLKIVFQGMSGWTPRV